MLKLIVVADAGGYLEYVGNFDVNPDEAREFARVVSALFGVGCTLVRSMRRCGHKHPEWPEGTLEVEELSDSMLPCWALRNERGNSLGVENADGERVTFRFGGTDQYGHNTFTEFVATEPLVEVAREKLGIKP